MGITCCLQTRFLLTISSPSASIFSGFVLKEDKSKWVLLAVFKLPLLAAVRGMRTKRVAHSTLVFIALPVRNGSLAPTMLFI